MNALLLTVTIVAVAPLGAGDHVRTLKVDGRTRSYRVHLPKKYDPKHAAPLVLIFHGGGTNAALMIPFCGINEKSDREGFIAVYPNGTGPGIFLTHNAGCLVGKMAEGKADDVKFAAALLDQLPTVLNIDTKRVYATGMSNGGMMRYLLAARLPHRIAAIAPVSGTLAVDETPNRPVPTIHFHGTADPIVPWGGPDKSTPKFLTFKSVTETIKIWAAANKCDAQPLVEKLPDKMDDGTTVTRMRYRSKSGGAEVQLVEITGGGHTWPGKKPPIPWIGRATHDISANDLIWTFFQRHSLSN